MTDKPSSSGQPEKKDAPAAPSSSGDTKKDTKPLNPDVGINQKPPAKLDPEIQERLRQMMNNRKQPREETSAAAKPGPVPAPPGGGQPAPKEVSTAQPTPKTPPSVTPAKADAAGPGGKDPAWPVPARVLGSSTPSDKPDAASTPASGTPKPVEPPAAPPPVSMETSRLNRQLPDSPAGMVPADAKPTSPEEAARKKAEAQAAIRTTSATRNVPKGRVAQEVWKVIFQAMTGPQAKDLGVEVKGLSVVGRADPDGESKADLDLTPFNAGAYGVSRQHVILFPTDEGPCVIDLNSRNGTWINGLYLEPGRKYRLRSGDRIELGSLKMMVRVMAPGEQQPPPAPDSSRPPADKGSKPGS